MASYSGWLCETNEKTQKRTRINKLKDQDVALDGFGLCICQCLQEKNIATPKERETAKFNHTVLMIQIISITFERGYSIYKFY